MTERLYHADQTLREFTARIVARQSTERGAAVALDRTAFYPTAGGQPHDTGTLDGAPVVDVWEDTSGTVWHLVERLPPDDEVRGEIDWERRFDHMQQHTGQHLLSAAFVHLLRAPTLSVHLGTTESHVDFDLPDLTWDDAFRVEADVNRVICENRPVEVHVVPESELGRIPLRRPPKVSGLIRVVWVRDYDAAACGGTHVERTGALGLLKIVRIDRYKGGVRVGFLSGARALRDYQRALRSLQTVSADLSVHPDELGPAVERLRGELRDARRELRAAQDALMAVAAARLWTESPQRGGIRGVVALLDDHSFEQARAIAAHASGRPRTVALLAVREGKGVRLVCRRSDDLQDVDAAHVLRRAAERLGGRGGGTAEQAEGGGPARASETILEALREALGGAS